MAYVEKHIVNAYSTLFEGLSPISKIELIEVLTKSLKADNKTKKDEFYNSFGAFGSKKSLREIFAEIKANRKFRVKEIKL